MALPTDLLKHKTEYFGLDAPTFLWIAAAGFVIWTAIRLGHLTYLVIRTRVLLTSAAAKLHKVREQFARDTREGLSLQAFDAAAQVFESLPLLKPIWQSFAADVILRQDRNGQDRYWAPESASQTFTDAAIIDPRVN